MMRVGLATILLVVASAAAEPTANDGKTPDVLASGARVVVLDQDRVVTRRSTGAGVLVLQRTTAARDRLSATVGRFLDQAGLIDVVVRERWQQGWHGGTRETHYVIDISGPTDEIACAFDGAGEQGGEYSSTSTEISIAIKKTSDKRLAFDVSRQAVTRVTHPVRPPETSASVSHYKVGDPSCAYTSPTEDVPFP